MSASSRHYERGRGSNQGRNRRGPILGYRKLQQLSKANPSEIVEGLVHCRQSYKMLINSEHIKEDWIPLLIVALSKMCSSKMNQNVVELLQELQQSSFLSKHLPQYILQLHLIQEDVEDTSHFMAVLSSMCTFFKEWLVRFPNSYFELPLDAFSGMLKRIIIVNVSDIDKEMDTMLTNRLEKIKRDRKCDKKDKQEPEGKPPNNFREISVYPTEEDIHSRQETFLRKNRIERSYDDLDDYLDVQFRLLREDFVAPLRTGIQEILSDAPKDKRSQDLYIYWQVEIREPLCTKSGIAHRISFDITRLKGVPWEHSKRLMYGSFLCLSSDKFKKNLIFATVANRKHEDLRKGYIDIRFIQGQQLLHQVDHGQKLLMVESPAYFESYRHVLARLQEIDQKTFPFQKYLVGCGSNVELPLYLRGKNVQKATYDLRGALGAPYHEEAKQVPVLDFASWPSSNEAHETLNRSQMEALQAALSKEFAVIQGPPGTGKTYVGLKIVRALLDNRETWNAEGSSPLLMVCYTNHALDQFLEGVLEFTPSGIIRVGGQSSSEKLKDLNLHLFTRTSESRPHVLSDMRACQEEIEREKTNLQRCNMRVLQLSELKDVIPVQHFYQLAYEEYKYKARKESVVEAWLGIQRSQDVKQCIAMSIREGERHGDKNEENITVDEDAEVQERQLYQNMEEFLPVVQEEDHTQDTKCEESTLEPSASLQGRIPQGGPLNAMTDKEAKSEKFRKIWKMEKKEDRWRLYLFWLRCYQKRCLEKINQMSENYDKMCQRLNEVEDNDRLKALKEATVIGMTTTGAAKYRTVLEQIQPKIVIVEEAAEVLEAHIIAAVSQGTQHLILIGDHKQLKPNPTVYQLATKYNLNISLFERMVKNGMHCNVLTTQHRMRPKISLLMKHIYTDLQDHPTVCDYDNILGVKNNVFFIDHQYPEKENKELRSPSNKHEAEYIRELCRYLLLQGYSPHQITVLTTYTGQLLELRKLMPRTVFEGVRVTAVDNFQGEENDIILLSLVRSNERGHVGFLKINNRVCVALSRARMGFYCIGNFKALAKNSALWSAIVDDMQKRRAIGNALELVCENHPDSTILAESGLDFKKAPEGGCTLPCDYRLDCGHVCEMVCHPVDTEHEEYTCRKKCLRLLCGDHDTRCEKECHYGSPCGPCPVQMEKRIPACGHTQSVLCGTPAENFQCQEKCKKKLQCGHPCPTKCFVDCTSLECEHPFVRSLPCGHEVETTCSKKYDFVRCEIPCEVFLGCLHPCPGNCSDCHQGRLHVPCQQPCQRDLVCQHQCDFPCTKNCPPCEKKCQNRCMHSKCPSKCKEICTPCKEPCGWRCRHYVCNRLCGELCAHVRCDKPCRKRLPSCGHPCIGLCGEKCPRLCRICDEDEVTETFFGTEEEPDAIFIELIDCGHVIEVGAMDAYMTLNTEEDPSEEEEEEEGGGGRRGGGRAGGGATANAQNIKLKGCPKCNTPIRRSFRYGDIVNQTLRDIAAVKQKMLDEEKEMMRKRAKLERSIKNLSQSIHDCDLSCFQNWLQQRLSADELTTIKNQLRLLVQIYKTRSCVKKDLLNSTKQISTDESYSKTLPATKRHNAIEEIDSELGRLETALRQFQISEQALIDVRDEILRVRLLGRVRSFECELADRSPSLSSVIQLRIAHVNSKLTRGNKISNAESENLQDEINKLRINLGLGVLSKEERVMIVKAMGFSQGHWYKCPKGHIYAIGECGGASQEATCPDCNSRIGGTNHKLLAGNEVATEMDGARYGAWSEQGNLANYDPEILRRLQFE